MDALPNADTRRGGKNPSSAGLTSCTSPEVQSHETKNSQTGCPRIVCPKVRSNGLFYVPLMVEQRKLMTIFKLRILRHTCRCIMSLKK